MLRDRAKNNLDFKLVLVVVLVLGFEWRFAEVRVWPSLHAEYEDEYDDEDEPKVPSFFCADPEPVAERSLSSS